MPTLSEFLRAGADAPEVAPRAPALPYRLPGGKMVRGSAGRAAPAPPPRRGLIAAGWDPRNALGTPPAPTGAFARPPAPRAAPGGIPNPAGMPPTPPAPSLPAPGVAPEDGRRAPKVVTLYPNAFADTWSAKPAGHVEVGIRLLADSDLDKARANASRVAYQNHPAPADVDGRIEAFNEALMQWAVARGTCKPHDVRLPFWEGAQDVVPAALTEDGIRLLFHEIQALKIEQSPLQPEARVDELAMLQRITASPELAALILERAEPRLRRHIAWVVEQIVEIVGPQSQAASNIMLPIPEGPIGD